MWEHDLEKVRDPKAWSAFFMLQQARHNLLSDHTKELEFRCMLTL
jgi:hypothetical protein